MTQLEYLTDWMAGSIRRHSAVSQVVNSSERRIRVDRKGLTSLTIAAVSVPILEVSHVESILEEEIATIICLVPRTSHYVWAARELANSHGSSVHSVYELKASLSQSDPRPFRNKDTAFIQRAINGHSRVKNAEMICEASILVKRHGDLGDIKVAVEHVYEFGHEALVDALERHPGMNAIVNSNPNGRFTEAATAYAREARVGVFRLGNLMGALNYAGDSFINYRPREENGRPSR